MALTMELDSTPIKILSDVTRVIPANHECVFCSLPRERILEDSEYAIAFRDAYPVTRGHTLIAPKRCVPSWVQLREEELADIWKLSKRQQKYIEKIFGCDGFNIAINDGPAAGQTVLHLHVHIIPRYVGDVEDPRGGVRWLFPEKARYW